MLVELYCAFMYVFSSLSLPHVLWKERSLRPFYLTHQSYSNDPLVSTETCWRRLEDSSLSVRAGSVMEPLTCTTAISANEERSFKMVQANCLIRAEMSRYICMGDAGN